MVWLAGWSKKIKFTLDNTKVYEDLLDFPLMLKLTSSHTDLFTTVDNNYNKILLLDSISNDILYSEVVYWDSAEQKAVIWTKVPVIPVNKTIYIYLFYDALQTNTKYIGTTSSLAAMQVWQNKYAAVYHMNQTINTPFTAKIIYANEVSGTSATGTTAIASTTFGAQNCTGLTKATGALSIWLKVNNPDFIDLWSGVYGQLEISSSASVDTNEWYFSFPKSSEATQYFLKNINTTYKKFIFPLSEFISSGGELNVSAITRIRLYVQASTETILTVYWKNAEIIYYPGGILDSVGHSHGKPLGNMSSNNLVEGLNSKATLFDGSTNYIDCGFSEKLGVIGELTLEAVVKQNIIPTSSDEGIINKAKTSQCQYSLCSKMDSGVPVMKISSTGSNLLEVIGTTNITTINDFVYIAGTYQPTVKQEIFLNGIKENSSTSNIPTTLINTDVAETVIGAYWDNTSTTIFNGIIDEIFISSITRSDNWIKTFNDNLKNNLINNYNLETLTSGTLAYNNKIKLTISPGHIDGTLYNFPVLINVSKQSGLNGANLTNIFHELEGAHNYKKIAITDNSGQARCFCEVESWSHSEKEAFLWVNVPIINATTDTVLYLYYDKEAENSNFIGTTTSYIGNKVWNSNHFAVYHLSSDPRPYIYDATENKINLLPNAYLTTSCIENAVVGKSLYFSGATIANQTNIYTKGPTNNFAFECVCKVNVTHGVDTESNSGTAGTTGQNYVFSYSTWFNSTVSMSAVLLSVGTNGISVYEHCSSYMPPIAVYNGTIGTEYNHICVVYINRVPSIYLNGTKVRTGLTSDKATIYADLKIGDLAYGGKFSAHKVRIYNDAMSDAWVKASYYNSFDKLIVYTLPTPSVGWLKTYENGELSPWANRIKLEIDNTKIDENLIDFPILINISEESGITNKDIKFIIDALSNTYNDNLYNDDFYSYTLNSDLWFDNNASFLLNNNGKIKVVFGATYSKSWTTPGGNSVDIWETMAITGAVKYNVIMAGTSEGSYDYVYIYDYLDTQIKRLSGTINENFYLISPYIKARFTADGSATVGSATVTVSSSTAYIKSKYIISGNFDIQVDFEDISSNASSIYAMSLGVYSTTTPINYASIGAGYYASNIFWARATNTADVFVNRDYATGSFRLVRVGAQIYSYFKYTNDVEWVLIKNTYIGSDDMYVALQTYRENDTYTPEVYFSNYKVELYKFNDKKIAITSEDGTTQLPIEEALVDSDIQLWAKLPIVKQSELTTLYFYYDIAKSDNTNYIGATDSSIARSVWDANYKLIYHMTKIPTTGILDSTSNGNTGTATGLTTSSLISTEVGKGLYFTSTAYISTPHSSSLVFSKALTVEIITKINNIPSGDFSLVTKGAANGALSFGIAADSTRHCRSFSDSDGTWGPTQDALDTNTLVLNEEVYLASTFNGEVTKLFKNNNLQATSTTSTMTLFNNTSSLVIGKHVVWSTGIDGYIKEVRISDTVRSGAWLKATHNTSIDNLISFNDPEIYSEPPIEDNLYTYQGYVKNKGIPMIRAVLLYERSTGTLMDSTISDNQGFYLLETPNNTEHFIVVLDSLDDYKFAPLIQDRLLPNGD